MKSKLSPFIWSGIVMVLALALTLSVAPRSQTYFEEQGFASPDVSLGPIVGYFFGVVVVMAVVLFLIPLNALRVVFRVLFSLMFAWGVFIITGFTIPLPSSITLAVLCGAAWLFWARVWLHDLLLLVTLSGASAIFGYLFSPLTFVIFMLIISVYDVMAVRFGFMVWMADRLSDIDTLPAFIFPRNLHDWLIGLRRVRVGDLTKQKAPEREYSILGGGDIGFPLMLAASVVYQDGLNGGIIIGAFAFIGLMGAYLVQLLWLRDKPVPALPPIALASLAGFLIVHYTF
jgi:presenilin-like A22 family membrane protease